MKRTTLLIVCATCMSLTGCLTTDYALTGSINATIPVEGMTNPVNVGIGFTRPARMSGKSAKQVQPVQP